MRAAGGGPTDRNYQPISVSLSGYCCNRSAFTRRDNDKVEGQWRDREGQGTKLKIS